MDIQKLRDSKLIVDKVEEALQAAYSSNKEFNAVLDEADPLSFKSLRDPEHEYLVKVSDALYWVERDAYLDELDHWQGQREVDQHEAATAFIKASDQQAVFLDLVDAVRSERIAPFVGAGLSRPCGYPMWGEALRKIAQKLQGLEVQDIEPLMAQYDYLQAAQVLHDAAAQQVQHFIKTEFRQRGAISGPVALLPQLANGYIVTTNFDTAIEDLFKEKDQLPKALRQIFISHSLLFLGCSLEQDKTLDLFKSVVDEGAFEIPDHFALLNEPATPPERARKEARLLQLKIRPLWYATPADADGKPDHGLLEQILKLAIAVARRQVVFA